MESQTEEAGCTWCAQDNKEVMWPWHEKEGKSGDEARGTGAADRLEHCQPFKDLALPPSTVGTPGELGTQE